MDIGLEIKILRERKQMSAKELAEKVGLSPSQVSRLEKGQRRIDTQILHKIARALDVTPAFFFQDEEGPPRDIDERRVYKEVGRLVRIERRKRHLSAEELAKKIGKTRPFVQAVEEGRRDLLDRETVTRIGKALRLGSTFFFEVQQDIIQALKQKILRLERELSDRTLGAIRPGPDGWDRRPVPILGEMAGEYPATFDEGGMPVDRVADYVFVPGVDAESAFAVYARGDSMDRVEAPSFREGDILVFSAKGAIRSRDFAFARTETGGTSFRQVFFDPNGTVRLQPLNLAYPAGIYHKEEVIRLWKLAAHVARP